MNKKCCINKCRFSQLTNARKSPKIQLFRFPSGDKEILKKWTDFVEFANSQILNSKLFINSLICAEHFEPNQFDGRNLKTDAIPSKLRNLSITSKPSNGTTEVIVISDSDDDEPQVVIKEPKKQDTRRRKPTANGPSQLNGLVKGDSSKDLIVIPCSPMKLPEVSKPSPPSEDVEVVPLKSVELPQVEKPPDTPQASSSHTQVIELPVIIKSEPITEAEGSSLATLEEPSVASKEDKPKPAIPLPYHKTDVDVEAAPRTPPPSMVPTEELPSTSTASPILEVDKPDVTLPPRDDEEDKINYINEFLHLCRSMIGGDPKGVKILQGLHKCYMKCRHVISKHSQEFGEFLNLCRAKLITDPEHLYNHLIEVYKYLDKFTAQVPSKPPFPSEPTEDILVDVKQEAQIKKLEKLLEKLDRNIKKLELRELSLDDEEEESAYILEDRYKKRFMKVWKKLCKLHKQSSSVGMASQKKYVFSDSPYPELKELTRNIEAFVNQKQERIFPDFQDIVNIIKETHASSTIPNYNDITCLEMARKLFTCVGNRLKDRRQRDLRESLLCYATLETSEPKDPADEDPELNSKLEESSKAGQLKVQKVVDEFAMKQLELNTSTKTANEEENKPEEEEDDEEEEEEEEEEDKEDDDKIEESNEEIIKSSDEEESEEEEEASVVAQSIFQAPARIIRKRKAEEAPDDEPPAKVAPP